MVAAPASGEVAGRFPSGARNPMMSNVSRDRSSTVRARSEGGATTFRRRIAGAIAAAIALGILGMGTPASADPGDPQGNVASFPMVCDGEPVGLRVGGGPWSAAHVTSSKETFVPIATYVSMRDAATLELLYEESDAKGKPRGGSARCVDEFTADGVLITFVVHGHMH
jgi:hypothetical protein